MSASPRIYRSLRYYLTYVCLANLGFERYRWGQSLTRIHLYANAEYLLVRNPLRCRLILVVEHAVDSGMTQPSETIRIPIRVSDQFLILFRLKVYGN
jgi:hypothetical protein